MLTGGSSAPAAYWSRLGPATGPDLVFCHGMALDHRDLLGLAEAAAGQGWHVLVWDMPGHGKSGAPGGGWSIAAVTDTLERVLDEADIARAMLLGFSFGGVVAQEFARRHPDRVHGLIAYACFAPALTGPLVPPRLAGIVNWLVWGRKSWARIKRDFARMAGERSETQAHVADGMDRVGKEAFLALSAALLTEPRAPFRPDAPLLLLYGEQDSNGAALRRAMRALTDAQSRAETVVIPGAGHLAHLDAPEAVRSALLAFLERHKPASAIEAHA